MWSRARWWWERKRRGALLFEEKGVSSDSVHMPWESLWKVRLEVWLVSAAYLEVSVSLLTKPRGAKVGEEVSFKVVMPHQCVCAQVHVKQQAGTSYVSLEEFRELWPPPSMSSI